MRDAAHTLAVALKSVLRSRGVPFEVVAVDHASQDGTREILARFPMVRVIDAPAEFDLARVLELGRRACAAPFIARMDADDVMHPDRLAQDVAWLESRTTPGAGACPRLESRAVDAVACKVKLIGKAMSAGMRAYVSWQNAATSSDDHAREIWIEQPLCHPATTFRASVLEDVGGYRSGPFAEDYDLFLRMIAAGRAIEKRAAVHHAWRQHANTHARFTRDSFAELKAQAMIGRFHVDKRPVFICGAGKEGRRIARALVAEGVRIAAFFDVKPAHIGRTRRGAVVLDARELARMHRDHTSAFAIGAVGTSGARGVVRAHLREAGFIEGENAVVVA